MEEFIKDAKDASRDNDTLTSYDKEWETKLWGKEEGIEETKINIVKNMLNENLDLSLIEKITGLTKEEIKDIQNNN